MTARTVFSLIFAAMAVGAQADDSIVCKLSEYDMGRVRYEKTVLAHPALRHLSAAPSLSSLSIKGMSEPSSVARIPQLGNGGRYFGVAASSFQHLGSHSVVWGNASYENGRKYNVVWNETSDFAQIYPYVMADSRGGDMKYEEYRLDGGYSAQQGKLHYGLELGYRALSEYRDRDPRPNNTVADLYARVGMGYELLGDYVLAVAADAGKYKQTNELAYYNELGAQMEYHLTGIGNDFARFSGQSNNTFFKGYHLGAELSLARKKGTGWSAAVGYLFTQKEKVLTDLNRLPLNQLKIHTLKGGVGYGTEAYGIRLSGYYADRKGYDNLFGDATGNVYPQIGTKQQYSGSVAEMKVNGFWTVPFSSLWTINVEPEVAYRAVRNSHQASGNHFDSDDFCFGAHGNVAYIKSGNRLSLGVDVMRRQNLTADLAMYGSANETLTQTLQSIKKYFAEGETTLGVGAEYTRKVWENKAVTLGFHWQHSLYLGTSGNHYEAKIGFSL